MLKRHQVLLEDWMTEYAKFVSKKYDISFSEAIRGMFSLAVIFSITTAYPRYDSRRKISHLKTLIKKAGLGKLSEVEIHSLLSKLYFEARKAAEFRISRKSGAISKK